MMPELGLSHYLVFVGGVVVGVILDMILSRGEWRDG